jgi:hypothetical protein
MLAPGTTLFKLHLAAAAHTRFPKLLGKTPKLEIVKNDKGEGENKLGAYGWQFRHKHKVTEAHACNAESRSQTRPGAFNKPKENDVGVTLTLFIPSTSFGVRRHCRHG